MFNKIYIIGPVGSGKTTFAKSLSNKYSINYYELDKVVFDDDNGNIKRTDEEIAQIFNNIIKKNKWIIEDVGRKNFIEGIKKADIVYYLDLNKYQIYKRCLSRWFRQRIGKENYNYKPTLNGLFEMLGWARKNTKKKDKKIKRIIDNCKDYRILNLKEISGINSRFFKYFVLFIYFSPIIMNELLIFFLIII